MTTIVEMECDEKTIVENIRKIRITKGMKQQTVANGIDVDDSTYSKLESGSRHLSIDNLARIATFFGMDMIDIITYPKRYVDRDTLSETEKSGQKPKVLVQLELEEDKKEQVLKILFADHALSIIGNTSGAQ